MKRIVMVSWFLVAARAWAVVDISPEEVGANPGVSGNVAVSYSTKSGNTEKDEADASAKLVYDSNRNYLAFAQGTYERTKSSDVLTEDKVFGHARYLHKLGSKTLYGEAFLQAHQDVFKGIDDRWLLGGNLRWRFLSGRDLGKLYVGVGAFQEELNYTDDFTEEDTSHTRLNSYLAYTRPFTESATFTMIGYYQPNMQTFSDYYTALDVELSVRVVASIRLSLTYEMDQDSRPPEGIEKVDQEISTSLIWEF